MESSKMAVMQELPPNTNTKPINNNIIGGVSKKIWEKVKPFANGGVVGILAAGNSYAYLTCYAQYKYVLQLLKRRGPDIDAHFKATHHSKLLLLDNSFKVMRAWFLFEAVYTTARLGSFEILSKKVEAANDGRPLTLYEEACCGLTAGAIGAFVGSPIFVAMNSMYADVKGLTAQKMNYRNVFHVLHHTASQKGILAMWNGAGQYAYGAMALSTGMLASYNRSFSYLYESVGLTEWQSRLGAGAVSGFFASACSLPFENVYQVMNSAKPHANGKCPIGFLDCASQSLNISGPSIFYNGFLRHFFKTTPNVMATWIILEEIRKVQESKGL